MGYIVRGPDGPLVDGRRFYTASTSPSGSGDQTVGLQAAVDYAADQEIKGLWLGRGTLNISAQILFRNLAGFTLQGAGAQVVGMGNAGSPPARAVGTRLIWRGDAVRACLAMSDGRANLFQDFGFHVSPTEQELLAAIDCYSNSADAVVTPTGNMFRRLSFNGVNTVGGHSQFHFGIRFPGSASYLPPANAQDGNNDFAVVEDCEFNVVQIPISLDCSQQKNMQISRVRAYGVGWNQLTETDVTMKQKCIVAVGAMYNPSTDAWVASVGGNFHARDMSGSRSVVADVVIGQPNSDGSSWEGGNIEGSARLIGRMPGAAAVNLTSPFIAKGVRSDHKGGIALDRGYVDMHWPGPLILEGCTIEDSNQTPLTPGSGDGVASNLYNPLHVLVEPPTTNPSSVTIRGCLIHSESYDLVRVQGANPRRLTIASAGNLRRKHSDDTYTIFPETSSEMLSMSEQHDDFATGNTASTAVGETNWQASSGANVTTITSEASHPGMVRLTTTTTISTTTYIRNQINSGGSMHVLSEVFDALFILRLNTSDANTTARVGLVGSALSAPPTTGAYLEKADADTNWFFVCGQGSVYTRVDTGIAATAGTWRRLRIRRVSATEIGFTLDNGIESLITTNLPTTAAMSAVQITNSAAAAKTIDLDFWRYRVTGLIR